MLRESEEEEMKRQLPTMLVKHKVWAGYALMLGILAVVSVSAYLNLGGAQGRIQEIVHSKVPASFEAMQAVAGIEKASANLGYYLLTQGDGYRDGYQQSIAEIDGLLASLQGNPLIGGNDALRAEIQVARERFEAFRGYEAQLLELPTNFSANMPAVRLSEESLNPMARSLLQYISEMVMAEDDQEATAERRELLQHLYDMRYAFVNIIAEMRAFTAFRGAPQLQNIELQHEQVTGLMDRIAAFSDIFSFEQSIAFEQFQELYPQYYTKLQETLELHGSDRYRTDAYLIRTEVSTDDKETSTSRMVGTQANGRSPCFDGRSQIINFSIEMV
ncbi:MAG: hypothetical protein SWZ49_03425 [Cyanobacteriota bacterium]|nr:hypothetical protein [Cyanobacteriota bacterium]